MSIARLLRFAVVLAASFPIEANAAFTSSVVDVFSRGVIQRFLYLKPDNPIANVIVFPGGPGTLQLNADGSIGNAALYAGTDVLSRALANQGYAVALVDAPSDRINGPGLSDFRQTPQHFMDMVAVRGYMQQQANVPTWLVGYSFGSISAVVLAAGLAQDQPIGLVLLSPPTAISSAVPGGANLLDFDLAAIRRPVLVLYHPLDECPTAPPFNVPLLAARFTGVPVIDVLAFAGGSAPNQNGPCPSGSYHTFHDLETEIGSAIGVWIGAHNSLLGGTQGPAAVDLNQHGLTGSWYEPATSGQGMELEFYTSAVAADTAFMQGAWFTFDAGVAGGAERQRWYTFSGNAKTGSTSIPVTIYQNTGGNFNAPPVTNPTVVGNGTLSFASCTAGTFNYTFADGSGRNGSIPLTRLTANVTCPAPAATAAKATNPDFGFTGNWYDAATSGQGFVVEVNPISPVLFLTWYTYAPNGQSAGAAGQRWYTGQASYVPGSRSSVLTLYETKGGIFDQPAPVAQTTSVGTAMLTLANCGAASINYNFTGGTSAGRSGTIALVRVGPTPQGCGP